MPAVLALELGPTEHMLFYKTVNVVPDDKIKQLMYLISFTSWFQITH